jgi:hypothetical protein
VYELRGYSLIDSRIDYINGWMLLIFRDIFKDARFFQFHIFSFVNSYLKLKSNFIYYLIIFIFLITIAIRNSSFISNLYFNQPKNDYIFTYG